MLRRKVEPPTSDTCFLVTKGHVFKDLDKRLMQVRRIIELLS